MLSSKYIAHSVVCFLYSCGIRTGVGKLFLGRGPDESQTSLSRARLEKTKSTHPNVNMTKRLFHTHKHTSISKTLS